MNSQRHAHSARIDSRTLAAMPQAIYVELTDLCNLTCPMCRCNPVKGNIMTLPMFSEMAAALFPTAKFVDLRGWGESTIIPNFMQYLDVALRYPAKIKLITNAVVRDRELWERLGSEGITVGISFDASEAALFRELRGGAKLDHVLDNVKILSSAMLEAGHSVGDKLYFCITVSGKNLDQLGDIVRLGMSFGIRRFKLEPLLAPVEDPGRLEYHAHRIPHALSQLAALSAQHDLLIELSAALLAEDVRSEAVRKVCIHPWQYLYINSRGHLGFCDHLNGREEYTFAHWSEGRFEDFWNGDEMRRLREEHLQRMAGNPISVCPDCNWCYDYRYMDLEDWLDPEWSAYRTTV